MLIRSMHLTFKWKKKKKKQNGKHVGREKKEIWESVPGEAKVCNYWVVSDNYL